MTAFRGDLLRQGTSEMQAWKSFQEIETIIGYLDGTWWGANRAPYRSQFYDNYLADQRRESLASLSDLKPSIDISSSVEAYKSQADVQDKYIRHLWNRENLDLKVVTWVDHALFGTGFLKQVARENQFMFSAHGPDTVIPVQCNGDLQESAACLYKTYKSLGYFQNSFGPEKCIGLERQSIKLAQNLGQDRYARPNDIPEYSWNALSPAMKRRVQMRNAPIRQQDQNYTPFPIVELMEVYYDDWSINETNHDIWIHHPDLTAEQHNYHYIVPPGCRLYPRKRLIVFAGDRVMYDGPAPFWHGLYPFTMLQLNPCVWSPGGISKYHDLIPLCRSLNQVGCGVDESVQRALNGTWVAKRGAIPEAVWDAFQPGKPGQKILLNPIANINEFKEMSAPNLPQQVGEWLKYLVDTVKRRSGSLDIQGLSRKNQAPGGDAIEQMRDTMSSPFRLEGRYRHPDDQQRVPVCDPGRPAAGARQRRHHLGGFFFLPQQAHDAGHREPAGSLAQLRHEDRAGVQPRGLQEPAQGGSLHDVQSRGAQHGRPVRVDRRPAECRHRDGAHQEGTRDGDRRRRRKAAAAEPGSKKWAPDLDATRSLVRRGVAALPRLSGQDLLPVRSLDVRGIPARWVGSADRVLPKLTRRPAAGPGVS